MEKVKSTAEALTALTGRVWVGKKVWSETDTIPEATVAGLTAEKQALGCFWATTRQVRQKTQVGSVTVRGALLYKLPLRTTSTLVDLEDMLDAILEGLLDDQKFYPCCKPLGGQWSIDETYPTPDGLGRALFEMQYEVGLISGTET